MLVEDLQAMGFSILAALPNLIIDGDGRLAITTETRVDGASKAHGVTPADGSIFGVNSDTVRGTFAIRFAYRSARYSRASAGMITLSAHSRNAGSRLAPSFSRSVTHTSVSFSMISRLPFRVAPYVTPARSAYFQNHVFLERSNSPRAPQRIQ